MHVRTIASVGYQRKFHNATGIRHLETLLHWTLSCLLASLLGVWCWLPLRGSTPTASAPVQLPTASLGLLPPTLSWSPATNYLCSCPTTNSSVVSCRNSQSPPRTTSGYGEISCPRILCLVSRQNRQLNRLLWQPTPIVLQYNAAKKHRRLPI